MHFMYASFDVLVLTEMPAANWYHGVCLSYMDKGWCWAECELVTA